MQILEQEQEAARILARVPAQTLGDRLRRSRLRQGRSIRDLAQAAGLSKTSIVRLEQGGSTYPMTVVKVCAALGLHLAGLADPPVGDDDNVVVHRHANDRWYDMTNFGMGPLGGQERPLTEAERAAFVKAEPSTVPLLLLTSRLPDARLLPTVIEVWSKSETRSHPGQELVYILKGDALVYVSDIAYPVSEGESIIFRSAEPHAYAPADGSPLPVRLLSVRLDDRTKR